MISVNQDSIAYRHLPHAVALMCALLSFATMLAGYFQLVLGANLRHIQDHSDPSFYKSLVVIHAGLAILIAFLAILLFSITFRSKYRRKGIRWLALALLIMIVTQLGLGVSKWIFKDGLPQIAGLANLSERFLIEEKIIMQLNVVAADVANGSLILAMATCLTIGCLRPVWPSVDKTITQNTQFLNQPS